MKSALFQASSRMFVFLAGKAEFLGVAVGGKKNASDLHMENRDLTLTLAPCPEPVASRPASYDSK